jgi:hypothetical protein
MVFWFFGLIAVLIGGVAVVLKGEQVNKLLAVPLVVMSVCSLVMCAVLLGWL